MNLELDYIDFPTAWAICREYDLDHHPRCSYVQTDGALLCDCTAVNAKWNELRQGYLSDRDLGDER